MLSIARWCGNDSTLSFSYHGKDERKLFFWNAILHVDAVHVCTHSRTRMIHIHTYCMKFCANLRWFLSNAYGAVVVNFEATERRREFEMYNRPYRRHLQDNKI